MVGTIVVWFTLYCSMSSMTFGGSKMGMNTDSPPRAGTPRTAAIEAAWNSGVWCR